MGVDSVDIDGGSLLLIAISAEHLTSFQPKSGRSSAPGTVEMVTLYWNTSEARTLASSFGCIDRIEVVPWEATWMWKRVDGKRTLGLADPGAFRDELNALVLAGTKTATAGLSRVDYEPDGEHIEEVGEQLVILDSDDEPLAVVEVTRVESHPFTSVPWELARDEGEGFETIDDFRAGYRREYGKQGIAIVDDDIVICIWFRLVRRFAAIDRAL